MERIMNKGLVLRIIISLIVIIVSIFLFFGPVSSKSETEVFVLPQNTENFDVAAELKKQGFVRSGWIMKIILEGIDVEPGGYRINKSMWLWQVTGAIRSKPSLVWVTIIGCQRREQMGELIGKKLGWDQIKLDQWNNAYKTMGSEYIEGVYYPDTYLLPVDETGSQIAERFINRFNEAFAPYSDKFQIANIRWVTALKIASLIEREAGGPDDMKVISGIIWNRLNTDMRLQIDATMQYTKGKKPDGSWWGGIDLSEKTSDSPYNTYLYKGLPPTPICSPGITSIEAVLNPEETPCLFYLHDRSKQIHCAQTYAEHKENIQLFLK
jgi:UPF0755 protein